MDHGPYLFSPATFTAANHRSASASAATTMQHRATLWTSWLKQKRTKKLKKQRNKPRTRPSNLSGGAPGQRAGRIAWRHSTCFTPEELEDIEVLKGKRLTIDQPIFWSRSRLPGWCWIVPWTLDPEPWSFKATEERAGNRNKHVRTVNLVWFIVDITTVNGGYNSL